MASNGQSYIIGPDEWITSIIELAEPFYDLVNCIDKREAAGRIAGILTRIAEQEEALFDATLGFDEDRKATPPEEIYLRLRRTKEGYTCERVEGLPSPSPRKGGAHHEG